MSGAIKWTVNRPLKRQLKAARTSFHISFRRCLPTFIWSASTRDEGAPP